MNAQALLLLALAAGPCDEVFDLTEACPPPSAEALEGVSEKVSPAKADALEVTHAASGPALAPRFLAASGTTALLAIGATAAWVVLSGQRAALAEGGAPDPATEASLRLQEGVATVSAASLYLGAAALLTTATAFFVFDPARGTLVEGFPRLEE